MADIADLQLDKDPALTTAPARSPWPRVFVAATVIAVAALGVYLAITLRQPRSNVQLQSERAVVPTTGAEEPRAVAGATVALAPLDQMDPLVRELVSQLSSHPKVAAWLTTDQLIRNFTVTVVNIAGGQSPAKHLGTLTPSVGFRATSVGAATYIDSATYRRYDDYGDAVAGLDAEGAARLYMTLKPRIDEAARELGEPNSDFTPTLQRAIIELLKTPVVEGPVAITRTPVLWEYADPRLASLSSAQRQLLRMGPRNVQLIQAKLREIAPHLGIATDKLPPPTVLKLSPSR